MSEQATKRPEDRELIPVPRGMSSGFYAFMAAGNSHRSDSGELLMLAPQRAALAALQQDHPNA